MSYYETHTGTVAFYKDDGDRPFGFIKPDENLADCYLSPRGFKSPRETFQKGDRVRFRIEEARGGRSPLAVDVELL